MAKGKEIDAQRKRRTQALALSKRRQNAAMGYLGDHYRGKPKPDSALGADVECDLPLRPSTISCLGRAGGTSRPSVLRKCAAPPKLHKIATRAAAARGAAPHVPKRKPAASRSHKRNTARQTVVLRDVISASGSAQRVNQAEMSAAYSVDTSTGRGSEGRRRAGLNEFSARDQTRLREGLLAHDAATNEGRTRHTPSSGRPGQNVKTAGSEASGDGGTPKARMALNSAEVLPPAVRRNQVYTSLKLGGFATKERFTCLEVHRALDIIMSRQWDKPELAPPSLRDAIVQFAKSKTESSSMGVIAPGCEGGVTTEELREEFEEYWLGKDRIDTLPLLGALEEQLCTDHENAKLHPSLLPYADRIYQKPQRPLAFNDATIAPPWDSVDLSYTPKYASVDQPFAKRTAVRVNKAVSYKAMGIQM